MHYTYIYVKIKDIVQRFRKFHRDMWLIFKQIQP